MVDGTIGEAAEALSRVRTARRAHILEAADRLVLREGYGAATMDRVAEEAGVSKQTLYNYFADKDALFIALMQKWKGGQGLPELRDALDCAGRTPDSCRQEFCAALQTMLGKAEGHDPAALFRLMLELAAERPRLSEQLRAALLPHSGDVIREAIERGVADGRLRQVDVEVVTAAILVLLAGYSSVQPLVIGEHQQELTPARMANGLADLLLYGLLPRDA